MCSVCELLPAFPLSVWPCDALRARPLALCEPHGRGAARALPAHGAPLLGKVLLGDAAALEEDSESRSEGSSPAFPGSSRGDGVSWGPPPSCPAPPLLRAV